MMPRHETRRGFLEFGLAALGVGASLPGGLLRAALAAPRPAGEDRVLVVLHLDGGHDALSELVPYGHREYADARKTTRIREAEVLRIDAECGLHPRLKDFHELLKEGAFAAIPGVGYPDPSYSHSASAEVWNLAAPGGRAWKAGWLGRTCDVLGQGRPDVRLGMALGGVRPPQALAGELNPGLVVQDPEAFGYSGDGGDARLGSAYRDLNADTTSIFDSEALRVVSGAAAAAIACSEEIRRAARAYRSPVVYPESGLARNLRRIAGFIHGGLPTRVYHTVHGGYDTHEGQRPRHDRLMAELNDAVAAFQKDLAAHGHDRRVLTFTVSEFGRRLQENGSEGTDHGAAAALYLFGPGVKAGILGSHPSLGDLQGGGGGSLRHRVDFRSVYATVLERWMGVQAERVLGQPFPLLDLLS